MTRTITTETELLELEPGTLMIDRHGYPMTRTNDGEFAMWSPDERRWIFYGVEEITGAIHGGEEPSAFFPFTLPDEDPAPAAYRRATSAYALRIAAQSDDLRAELDYALAAVPPGVGIIDQHYATEEGSGYVSLSFRSKSPEAAAAVSQVVLRNLYGDRAHPGAVLTTGLGIHRRVVAEFSACWCGRPATMTVPIDPEVTPWDGELRQSDGSPAAFSCDEHVRDGYERLVTSGAPR